jgi:hypothetical protein
MYVEFLCGDQPWQKRACTARFPSVLRDLFRWKLTKTDLIPMTMSVVGLRCGRDDKAR